MTQCLNRRSLLVAGAAGVIAVGLPGSEAGAAAPWAREADIVVVGTGAAGLAAAVTAVTNGDSVILLEKLPIPGGTTLKSGAAAWLPNNGVMRAAGLIDEEEACLRYMCRYAYPERFGARLPFYGVGEANHALLKAFYRNAAPAVDLLRSSGALDLVAFTIPGGTALAPDYAANLPEDSATRGRTLWPRPLADGTFGGPAMIGPMVAWLEKKRVPILTDCPVTALTQDGGRITGVEARQDGSTVRIKARKGVIFASGGYAHNLDLISLHQQGLDGSCATPGATGDFIPLAAAAGAAMGNLTTAWRMQVVLEEATANRFLAQGIFIPPGDAMILVDKHGRRVVNEKRNYNDRTKVHFTYDPVANEFPNRVLFMVFDQRGIETFGGAYPIPEAAADSSYLISGGDWDALSRKIAIRLQAVASAVGDIRLAADFAPTLAATVERFNGFARTGVDTEFGRGQDPHEAEWQSFFSPRRKSAAEDSKMPSPILYPFRSAGPYHAIIIGPGALDTSGGPLIDARARVLGAEGQPIPGLFGAGNCIASPTRGAYFGGGGTIGPALAYGHIAANTAHE